VGKRKKHENSAKNYAIKNENLAASEGVPQGGEKGTSGTSKSVRLAI